MYVRRPGATLAYAPSNSRVTQHCIGTCWLEGGDGERNGTCLSFVFKTVRFVEHFRCASAKHNIVFYTKRPPSYNVIHQRIGC